MFVFNFGSDRDREIDEKIRNRMNERRVEIKIDLNRNGHHFDREILSLGRIVCFELEAD